MPALHLDGFDCRTFQASRQLTYTYYLLKPKTPSNKPALFFLHGFPDSATMWAPIMPHFTSLDFPIIIPDLLGYDGTSKPVDPSVFDSKSMSSDLKDLVQSEGFSKVIPIGHDWGSFVAARFYNWNPTLCVGLILLNVAYIPPNKAEPFDLKKNNEMTAELLGYPNFAYWEFFTAPDAAEIIEANLESFWSVLHAEQPMRDIWCNYGAMREYLLKDKRSPLRDYAMDKEFQDHFINRMKRDGLTAPLNWYVSLTNNHHYPVEKDLPDENLVIKVPHFFLGCTLDDVCRPEFVKGPQDAGLLPDLTTATIDAPHWSVFSNPDEVGTALTGWLNERFT